MGNENDDLQNHQLIAAEAAGLLRLAQRVSDLADKVAINSEKGETNEGRLWAKLQAAEKAKDQETAYKIEAYRKNADLLERAKKAEAENADLRLRLAAARAILRDALSDLGE